MISFTSIQINSLESYEKLSDCMPESLIDEDVISVLKNNLATKCDEIRIEYPYYDTDYLSTFYIHYAQKLRNYDKKCCRLHILKNEEYYGYIVLRPTVVGTKFGRTLINPRILINEKAYIALYDFKAHIAGNTMSVSSFMEITRNRYFCLCTYGNMDNSTLFW